MRPLPHMWHNTTTRLYVLLETGDVAGQNPLDVRRQLAVKLLEIHCCRSPLTSLDYLEMA
jgi:hypothetical protein